MHDQLNSLVLHLKNNKKNNNTKEFDIWSETISTAWSKYSLNLLCLYQTHKWVSWKFHKDSGNQTESVGSRTTTNQVPIISSYAKRMRMWFKLRILIVCRCIFKIMRLCFLVWVENGCSWTSDENILACPGAGGIIQKMSKKENCFAV